MGGHAHRGLGLLLWLACLLSTAAQAQDRLALVGGTLIDGTGRQPVRNSIVLIEDGRITQVGRLGRLPIPAGYRLVSTEGMTVLPGLWDPLVQLHHGGHPDPDHWFDNYSDRFADTVMPASARQLLIAGVVGVRDVAADTEAILQVRQHITDGSLPGPAIRAAGAALTAPALATRPHLLGITDEADARDKTNALIEAGVDLIQVVGAAQTGPEVLAAVVSTAHEAGLRVSADGRTDEDIRAALAAGVDELQHIGTDSARYPPEVVAAIRDRIANGPPLYWTPTIGRILNRDELAANPEFLEDPRRFAGLPDAIELDIRGALAGVDFPVPSEREVTALKRKLQQLNELGVIMVFGSDMGRFGHPAGESTWRELEAWVFELGMQPLRAIQWATSDAATYLGAGEEAGSIRAGKRADIIAVRGSPLRHFSTLRDPAIIIRGGVRHK